jgi:hypothetical protein
MCGSAGDDERKFIDFGFQLDWYGAVYFCTECIKEFAQAAGYVPVEAFNNQGEELKRIQIDYDKLTLRNKAVENALSATISGKSNTNPDDDLVSRAMAIVEESNPVVESIRENDDGNSSAEQSPSIEGLDDFFDTSDLE